MKSTEEDEKSKIDDHNYAGTGYVVDLQVAQKKG
jgi:hypothetical protein